MPCVDSTDALNIGPLCLVGPEATVTVLGIVAAFVAIVGTAAVFLVQTTGERYSVRIAPWRLVTRRAAVAFGILLVLLASVALVAIFDFRRVWTFAAFETGLRADWGLVLLLASALAATAVVLIEIPSMVHPEALVARLVEPMFGEDIEMSRRVLGPARDVAAAALARSDLETWAFLVSQVREGIANNVLLWDEAERSNSHSRIFTSDVRSFVDFLTEASSKYGHQSATDDVVALVAHLLEYSVDNKAELPRSEFVRHAVRLVRWLLDRQLYAGVCELTRSLAEASSLENADPYPYAMKALRQVGDWIVQVPAIRTTYLEVVYYQDPFTCLIDAMSEAIERLDEVPSYEQLNEIQLVCEVILARSWKERSCEEIQEITHLLKRSAVLAAEQSGKYGYLLLLPIYRLHKTYDELIRKGCTDSARDVVEDLAEVVANGFRPGLMSQVGVFPRMNSVETLVRCDREMVIHGAREIYSRGDYMYIPEETRRRFTRAVQEQLDDLLGFTSLIQVEAPDGED